MFLGNVHFMCFVASYLVFVCYFLLFAPALHYCKACFFDISILLVSRVRDRVSCDQSTIFFPKLFFFFFLPVFLYQSFLLTANCSDQRIIGYINVILSHHVQPIFNHKRQIYLFPSFMLINFLVQTLQCAETLNLFLFCV